MAIRFHEARLSNGLTVIAEVDDAAHTAAAGFFVRTGSRDEPSALMGVSHFLEHMMFKGPEGMSAEALNEAFDRIGARNNAYTSSELTGFHAECLPEHLPRALELLARMMRPALREDDFERERQVILEEIAMYKDEPFSLLYDAANERHFRGHPMGHRVLGTSDTVGQMPRESMRRYFDARYSADNTVVALAGRLDFDACVALVDRECGHWQSTTPSRDSTRPPVGAGPFILPDAKVTRGYILGLAEAPAIGDDRRYASALFAQILGAPDNSRLHWALIEPGIAEEAQAGAMPHDGSGVLYVFAACEPERVPEVEGVIRREIAGLAGSIENADLERLRAKLATAVTVSGERPADRMHRLGQTWTYLRRVTTLEEELERILAVEVEDVRSVAEEFDPTPSTLGVMMPASAGP